MKLYQLWKMLFGYLGRSSQVWKDLKPERIAQRLSSDLETITLDQESINNNKATRELWRQSASDDLDTVFLRFLRARKWKTTDAFAMLLAWMQWRDEFGVEQVLRQGEAGIEGNLLRSGKVYTWGEDREGRVVFYLRARLHDKYKQSLAQSIRHMVWTLETGRWLRRHDEQLVTVVVDLQRVTLASLELPLVKYLLLCLQDYFPEILGRCLIVNAPWMFWSFWTLVKGLLDPVVAAKISFIKKEELTDYIDPHCIPRDFMGGLSPFKFHYPEDSNASAGPTCEACDLEVSSDEARELAERFVQITWEISVEPFGSPKHLELLGERDEIKHKMRDTYHELLSPVLPRNMYHRWGVLDDAGRIDWSRFTLPTETAVRDSMSDTTTNASLASDRERNTPSSTLTKDSTISQTSDQSVPGHDGDSNK